MTKVKTSHKNEKYKYYDLAHMDEMNADYHVIFGERGNGKTSAVLERIIKNWIEKGEQGVYMRTIEREVMPAKSKKIFNSHTHERGLVEKWTQGKWTDIEFYGGEWHLARMDEATGTIVKQHEPFCYAMPISLANQYKGIQLPLVTTICFDEFLQRDVGTEDDFVEFANLIATIIRGRDNVKIYMLGNTVNRHSVYFDEMGLFKVKDMQIGDIQLYEYPVQDHDTTLKVAVEYCGVPDGGERQKKKSDKFFAFNNPKLNMITTGAWEVPVFPRAPFSISHKDSVYKFYLEFRGETVQGDLISKNGSLFLFFKPKTFPIKEKERKKVLIYGMKPSPFYNHQVGFFSSPRNRMAIAIEELFEKDLVFFASNRIGELVRNYVQVTAGRLSYMEGVSASVNK